RRRLYLCAGTVIICVGEYRSFGAGNCSSECPEWVSVVLAASHLRSRVMRCEIFMSRRECGAIMTSGLRADSHFMSDMNASEVVMHNNVSQRRTADRHFCWPSLQAGFTLVELLVVIAIIGVLV